jgi:hypothetical protein
MLPRFSVGIVLLLTTANAAPQRPRLSRLLYLSVLFALRADFEKTGLLLCMTL